jgi:ribose-phosphate pyrophosphokinase
LKIADIARHRDVIAEIGKKAWRKARLRRFRTITAIPAIRYSSVVANQLKREITMATTATATDKAEKKQQQMQPKSEHKPQRGRHDDKFKIFCGTANEALTDEICAFLGMERGKATVTRFSDGECYVQVLENVRGADVFVCQPTCFPVDEHIMELLLLVDALKRASARRITTVIPYYGYARQDRKDKPRVPVSSKLIADLLTTAGAHRALVVDLHAPQIQGFFNIPVDHLFASPVLVDHFRKMQLPSLTVVSPDAGGVERARFFAKKIDAALAIVDKRRTDMNVAEVMHVIGDVKGRTCLIIDDIIDTAGTLVKTADALVNAGAARVYACASHAVLSGEAIERISKSKLEQVVVTNTIPLTGKAKAEPKIKVLSIAGLLGRAIQSIHEETSVSSLFA